MFVVIVVVVITAPPPPLGNFPDNVGKWHSVSVLGCCQHRREVGRSVSIIVTWLIAPFTLKKDRVATSISLMSIVLSRYTLANARPRQTIVPKDASKSHNPSDNAEDLENRVYKEILKQKNCYMY